MGRKLIIIVSILCFLVIMVIIEAILYFKNQQIVIGPDRMEATIEPTPSPLGPPAELSTNFDPTKNTPRFRIESANAGDKTLNLKFVFPHTWEGRRVTSRIICKDGDIKIVYPTDSTSAGEEVTIETLINKVQETSSELMIFSGLCGDNSCTEINKACQLYVAKN